jgi:hypothetical protein
MQTITTESENETWTHIAPLLDGAMEKLGQKDHDALVLRFLRTRILQKWARLWARARTRPRCA